MPRENTQAGEHTFRVIFIGDWKIGILWVIGAWSFFGVGHFTTSVIP